jgi:hypothetical protein
MQGADRNARVALDQPAQMKADAPRAGEAALPAGERGAAPTLAEVAKRAAGPPSRDKVAGAPNQELDARLRKDVGQAVAEKKFEDLKEAANAAPAPMPPQPTSPSSAPPAQAYDALEAAKASQAQAQAASQAQSGPAGAAGGSVAAARPSPQDTLARQKAAREELPLMNETVALSTLAAAPLEVSAGATFRVRTHDGRLESSADGGSSWHTELSGVIERLRAGACLADGTCWLVGDAGAILRREPAGTWVRRPLSLAGQITGVTPTGPASAVITASNGRYETVDAGVTWRALP